MKNISLLRKVRLTFNITLLPFTTLYASDIGVTKPLIQTEEPIIGTSSLPTPIINYTRYSSTPWNMEQSVNIFSDDIVSISNGDTPLKEGTDYTINSSQHYSYSTLSHALNISTEYLDNQDEDFISLKISYKSGQTQFVDVNILPVAKGYKLSVLTGIYDISKAKNYVEPWINCSYSQIKSITTADKTLKYLEDYDVYATMDSIGISFQDDFLKTLPLGDTDVTFTFTNGNSLTYTINVVNNMKKSVLVTIQTPSDSNTFSLQNKLTLSSTENGIYALYHLKVRYYYTSDNESLENVCIDNADLSYKIAPWYESITSDVKANLVKMDSPTETANTYLELNFDNTSLLTQDTTLTISPRIYHTDWSSYDQANDYSALDPSHICVYYDDTLIAGIEPK